jgi:leucyl aminopeptidase
MNSELFSDDLSTLDVDLLAFTVQGDADSWSDALQKMDQALDGLLTTVATEEEFEGKPETSVVLHTHGRVAASRIALVGVGEASTPLTSVRNHAASASALADRLRLKSVCVVLAGGGEDSRTLRFALEGAALGIYRFNAHRTRDVKEASVERIVLALETESGLRSVSAETLEHAQTLAKASSEAIALARDLVNEGPRTATPQRLADVARQIAEEEGLECIVHEIEAIQERKMELLLAVNAGSDLDARLIHLTYRPENVTPDTPALAFVGKGLTFDAGGYNIKPTGAIDDMKIDMAGGAVVLGAMKAISVFAPDCVVHGIVPSTENLINGSAMKLGDIYTGQNGKTVEIRNTDAEGRLILADGLCYANEQGIDEVFTLATLTGACVVALGPYTAGIFSNKDAMRDSVLSAAERVGEDAWPLPLNKKMKRMLKSDVADLKNVGERWGGAITAALFLEEFVDETDWTHIDLAGPSYLSTSVESHISKGGTGWGVLTLLEYAADRSS